MTSVRTAHGIIADDLTGAGDAGVQFAAAGLRTRTLCDDWTPESLVGAEVVVVDTASRGLAAEQAYRRVRAAAARLQAATQVMYKKIDSTLRGPLGAEIDAVLDACGLNLAIVCPAYPANGRTLKNGVLLVGDIPVAETAAAADPQAPVLESHLPTLLKRQTRRTVQWLHRPPSGHMRATVTAELHTLAASCRADGAVVVCDAQDDADLAAIVLAAQSLERGLEQGLAPLLVGSAGLARPLAASLAAERNPGILVLCGSLHPAARSQLHRLEQANDPRITILATPEQAGAYADPAAALAEEAQTWLAAHAAYGIVVTGGDTLHAVLRALQAHGVDLVQEAAPGIPLGHIAGGPWAGLRIVSKAGAFGGPDALADAAQLLMRKDPIDGR